MPISGLWGSGSDPGLERLHGVAGHAEEAVNLPRPGFGNAAFSDGELSSFGGGQDDCGDVMGVDFREVYADGGMTHCVTVQEPQ